ncbi:MAG: hypothetical protein M3Q81_04365 [bacterium]|nr:hypothetical protein [bacterium]
MELLTSLTAPHLVGRKFLAIILTDLHVRAALWQVTAKGIEASKFSGRYHYISEKELPQKTDEALQDLGHESEEVNEVIFAFEPDWVTPEGIHETKKPLLKQLTESLSLEAMGFIVIPEALLKELAKVQPHLTALLVDIGASDLLVSYIQQGKLVGTEHVGRSGETAADIAEALGRIAPKSETETAQINKLYLFSLDLKDDELKAEEQLLMDVPWVEQHLFFHPPEIDLLSDEMLFKTVIVQAGTAVINSVAPAATMAATATSFGIPIPNPHSDSDGTVTSSEVVSPVPDTYHTALETDDIAEEKVPATQDKPGLASMFKGKHSRMIVAGIGGGILVLIIGFFFFLQTTVQAMVTLKLKTVPVSKDVVITVDSSATASNPEELILAGQVTSTEVEGTKSAPVTGVKLVGEQAKGAVSLLNKTNSPKVFAAGTQLSNGKYIYTLDQEVTVASASVTQSGSNSETRTYGSADGAVTSSVIGPESNMPKDTELQIASFDKGTYAATVKENGLSGGSSREAKVISEQDRVKLQAELTKELIEQAGKELQDEASDGLYVVPSGKSSVVSSEFSGKVADEAENLSLTLTVKVEAITYLASDLQPLASQVLSSSIPEGFELSSDEPNIMSTPESSSSPSAQIKLNANVSAVAKPKISLDTWKEEVAGKPVAQALSDLRSKSEIESVDIVLNPGIAGAFIRSMPPVQRVQITVNESK